jgi:hypothetical protein
VTTADSRRPTLAAVALLLLFSLFCITSLFQKSASYDESHYLGVGRYLLTHQRNDIALAHLHPPLSSLLHGIPLLWTDIPENIWLEPSGDIRGQRIINLRDDDWLLNGPRLAMLPIAIALGWVIFTWSRRAYGNTGGLFSLALYCLSPNFIAHARLITPDLTLTLFTVTSAYGLWRLFELQHAQHPVGVRPRAILGWTGISLGLLIYSKYIALAIVAFLAVADLTHRIRKADPRPRSPIQWLALGRHWLLLGGIAVGLVWAGYGFSVGSVEVQPGLSIPMIAEDYFSGAQFQFRQSQTPHDFYFMDRHSTHGWWWFYLVVLFFKLPLPTLLLTGGLIVLALRGLRTAGSASPLEKHEIYLWLPAVLLLVYLSLFNTIHNGLRYLLPAYPLLLILFGRYARWVGEGSRLRYALVGALLWQGVACFWVWPDYLAYQNLLGGGPGRAYERFADSNLDWGQDLKQLKTYMDDRGIERIRLAYFGTADPAHYGIDYQYLPSANSTLRRTQPLAEGEKPASVTAISAYQYHGVGFLDKDVYRSFHDYVPNDLVGYSILIFDRARLLPRND